MGSMKNKKKISSDTPCYLELCHTLREMDSKTRVDVILNVKFNTKSSESEKQSNLS